MSKVNTSCMCVELELLNINCFLCSQRRQQQPVNCRVVVNKTVFKRVEICARACISTIQYNTTQSNNDDGYELFCWNKKKKKKKSFFNLFKQCFCEYKYTQNHNNNT